MLFMDGRVSMAGERVVFLILEDWNWNWPSHMSGKLFCGCSNLPVLGKLSWIRRWTLGLVESHLFCECVGVNY